MASTNFNSSLKYDYLHIKVNKIWEGKSQVIFGILSLKQRGSRSTVHDMLKEDEFIRYRPKHLRRTDVKKLLNEARISK